ncbi:hypothetical protein PPL_02801 [Heterostelium album PN500]|uniref:Uncharacterized protein n=1 Tax=Heterostelium pallidum (strain ATCC 26659 / Pp 5 / PN500) TaxID=670386 RepID=D3B336_HETP5|nr:hypothetical protein PPL_02801 [Heterostelium album PN500]EFA83734.1 hypothetical protein PPL_02801 [Heterostelium album PN500]|eukprot:XP_020435851.1 hypothetical protein PPL_02801 [Heterostelium album PN500]
MNQKKDYTINVEYQYTKLTKIFRDDTDSKNGEQVVFFWNPEYLEYCYTIKDYSEFVDHEKYESDIGRRVVFKFVDVYIGVYGIHFYAGTNKDTFEKSQELLNNWNDFSTYENTDDDDEQEEDDDDDGENDNGDGDDDDENKKKSAPKATTTKSRSGRRNNKQNKTGSCLFKKLVDVSKSSIDIILDEYLVHNPLTHPNSTIFLRPLDRIVIIMFHMRHYTTDLLTGFLFRISRTTVNRVKMAMIEYLSNSYNSDLSNREIVKFYFCNDNIVGSVDCTEELKSHLT